ncbi:MAG: HK97 family phage prohead protease [Flavobacteriaceae bacterium]
MKDQEKRTYNYEIRAEENDGESTIVGYAAVFNRWSENLGGFIEQISPDAFNNTDFSQARALFNHDPNFILGSVKSGSLKLDVDEIGLRYTIKAKQSQTINDLVVAPIKRGDLDQSSFGFIIDLDNKEADTWDTSGEVWRRTINDIHQLWDVSPVTYPAYRSTSVTARKLDELKSEKPEISTDWRKRKIKILKNK